MTEVRSLAAVSGTFDLIATVEAESAGASSTPRSTASAGPTAWLAPSHLMTVSPKELVADETESALSG